MVDSLRRAVEPLAGSSQHQRPAGAQTTGTTPGGARDDSLTTWGAWDVADQDDPHPRFAAMRERCPVQRVRLGDDHEGWLVVGHDAARQALRDPRLSKDMIAALDADPDVVDEGLPGPAFARHMLAVDPPDHTRLRGLVARAFVPSRITALEPAIERIAGQLLDQLETSGDVVDLVGGFAMPFPFRVIGELLGVPADDQPMLHRAFRTLLQPWTGSPPPAAVAASDTIVGYLEQLVDAHRVGETDDLVGVLVDASAGQERLSRQELLSSLFQLIVAGHDTTTSLIGNGMVALFDHPDPLRLLCDEPQRIPDAVEEMIRYDAPVPHATFRVTTEPVELDGVEIPTGQQVLVCIGAANRDPRSHADPDHFDVRRPPRSHLGFGHGIHFCLGAPLARLEGRVAFKTLLRRFPRVALAAARDELHWSHGDGLVLRGLASLPVRLGPPS
jgi:cytochrome P450